MTRQPTRVVHCKREPYDVYIGRPGPWGNLYAIGRDGGRDQVIAAYERYLLSRPDLMTRLGELRGHVLGCWCAPQACHGDVLARHADGLGPVHQEGQLRDWPCGCQAVWSRGLWHPRVTCREHATPEMLTWGRE
jgi:hypothetical protein